MHIKVRNASHALSEGLDTVSTQGSTRPSRNGPVIAMDEPTIITYSHPRERVIFYPQRDANPFFHLFECLWMLAGKRDVKSVEAFVAGMRNFSDDGKILNAAYGYRWRKHYGIDQLHWTVGELRKDGALDGRRTYISMWDPKVDTRPSLDIPCNTGICFRGRSDGRLDMTVFNRSNDLVLGATGANVVHMSFLHEVMCAAAGLPMGSYHQITNDLHLYTEQEKTAPCLDLRGTWREEDDLYAQGLVSPYPVMEEDYETWMADLDLFLQYGNVVGIRDRFFRRVCGPMFAAHKWYKDHVGDQRFEGALEILEQCLATDWRLAAEDWINRRWTIFKEKTR